MVVILLFVAQPIGAVRGLGRWWTRRLFLTLSRPYPVLVRCTGGRPTTATASGGPRVSVTVLGRSATPMALPRASTIPKQRPPSGRPPDGPSVGERRWRDGWAPLPAEGRLGRWRGRISGRLPSPPAIAPTPGWVAPGIPGPGGRIGRPTDSGAPGRSLIRRHRCGAWPSAANEAFGPWRPTRIVRGCIRDGQGPDDAAFDEGRGPAFPAAPDRPR